MEADESRIREFETPVAFGRWLKTHHAREPELWIRMFRKASGRKSIDWNDAVLEALCWGWIDGIRKSLDEESFLQRFTPRRKNSQWSKRNREHVERLIAAGRMQEPGLVHVRSAQNDGRWDAAYAPPSEMTVPEDFMEALRKRPEALEFFETLNRQNHYAVAYRLQQAKRPETRQRRIEAFITMLEKGEKFH